MPGVDTVNRAEKNSVCNRLKYNIYSQINESENTGPVSDYRPIHLLSAIVPVVSGCIRRLSVLFIPSVGRWYHKRHNERKRNAKGKKPNITTIPNI